MDTIDCPKCGCEHEPSGSHDDDAGEMKCEECGFAFRVEIEYDPSYSTSCVEHDWGDVEIAAGVPVKFCKHCGGCLLV